MVYLIYASEVGAAAGLNPYRSGASVMEVLWRRHDNGDHFERALHRLGLESRPPTSEEKLLVGIEDKVREAKKVGSSCSFQSIGSAVDTLTAGLDSSQRRVVESQLNCAYGSAGESKVVKTANVKKNNGEFRTWSCGPYMIGGRSDGWIDGNLIEIKHRRHKFMLPLYDMAQMAAYMKIYGATEITLVQHLGDQEQRSHHYEADKFFEKRLHAPLLEFFRKFEALLVPGSHQLQFIENPEKIFSCL